MKHLKKPVPTIKVWTCDNTRDDLWVIEYTIDGVKDKTTIRDLYRPDLEDIHNHILEIEGYK